MNITKIICIVLILTVTNSGAMSKDGFVIENSLTECEEIVTEPTESKFTLLSKASFTVAKQAIEKYDTSDYVQLKLYLESLPLELQASIISIIICQFQRSNIFAYELFQLFCTSFEEGISAEDAEQRKKHAIEWFNCFDLESRTELFCHLTMSVNELYIADKTTWLNKSEDLFMLINTLLQAHSNNKDLLSRFFFIITMLNEQAPSPAYETILMNISNILESLLKQWDEDERLSFGEKLKDLEKIRQVFLELLDAGEYQYITNVFNGYEHNTQLTFFVYLLGSYGCENNESAHHACNLGFFLLEPEAWQASAELSNCSEKFLLKALSALLKLCKIFGGGYPKAALLFRTSSSDFLTTSIEKNGRAHLLSKFYDFIDSIALKIIQKKLESFDTQEIKKLLKAFPEFNITNLYSDLLHPTDKLRRCSSEEQQTYLDTVFSAFLPSLMAYSIDDKNNQAKTIYHDCSQFYFVSDIQEPLTYMFKKYLTDYENYENKENAQDMLGRLIKLYEEDVNRIKYKKSA